MNKIIQIYLIILIGLFAECQASNSQTGQDEKSITNISDTLVVYDSNYSVVYPNKKNIKRNYYECGGAQYELFQSQKTLLVSFDQPFVVVANGNSQENAFKVLGIAQSQIANKSDKQKMMRGTKQKKIKPNSNISEANQYLATLIVKRTCQDPFTYAQYATLLSIYKLPKSSDDLQLQSKYLLTQISLNSLTYCTELQEVDILQRVFNKFYLMMVMIMISLLPVFPIKATCRWFLLGWVAASLLTRGSFLGAYLFINYIVYFHCHKTGSYQFQIEYKYQRDLDAACKANFSISVFFDVIALFLWIHSWISDQLGVITLSLGYVMNILLLLGVFQILGNIIWLNKFKHFFWWMVLVYLIISITPQLLPQNYKSIEQALLSQNTNYFSFSTLFHPMLLSYQCQKTSLFFELLIFPVCIYANKMLDNGFVGMMIMMMSAWFDDLMINYLGVWTLFMLMWILEILTSCGFIVGIRRAWIDRNTLNLMRV